MPLTTRYGFADAPTSAILGNSSLAWTTITAPLAPGGTTLSVASGIGFPPASVEFDVLVGLRNLVTGVWANAELLHVTVSATLNWTVSAATLTHAVGESVAHVLTTLGLQNSPGAMTDTGDLQYLASTGRTTRLPAGADGTYIRYLGGIPTAAVIPAGDLPADVMLKSVDNVVTGQLDLQSAGGVVLLLTDPSQGVDLKKWAIFLSAGALVFYSVSDAEGGLVQAMSCTRAGDMSTGRDFFAGRNFSASGSLTHAQEEIDQSYLYYTPLTGATITMVAGQGRAIINPAGTLALLTVTLPPTPTDGQLARMAFTQIITGLTVNAPGGATVTAPPASAAVDGAFTFLYRAASASWFPA